MIVAMPFSRQPKAQRLQRELEKTKRDLQQYTKHTTTGINETTVQPMTDVTDEQDRSTEVTDKPDRPTDVTNEPDQPTEVTDKTDRSTDVTNEPDRPTEETKQAGQTN